MAIFCIIAVIYANFIANRLEKDIIRDSGPLY